MGQRATADVVAAYRRHYAAGGMFETRLYPGIGDLLADLSSAGHVLAVATSKPEPYALPIIEHLGLAGAFDTVAGDTPDGARPTKAAVIAEALSRLGDRATAGQVLMIGDRAHDVAGAKAHGLPCLGAGWGYGAPGELEGAGALAIFDAPPDLGEWLGQRGGRFDAGAGHAG